MADRIGLGSYGEKIFGTGRDYVQSNVSNHSAHGSGCRPAVHGR